jgi:branched-chain amino acid transport system permease protein
VPGAFLGGLLLGFAETAWSALFPIEFRDLAIFVLLVFLLIVRPAGLFGLHEALPPKV